MSNAANTVKLNGQEYVVLPLNWKQLKANQQNISIINKLDPRKGMFSDEEQDAILAVITASLKRTRNDLTEEFVSEHLDLGNVGDLLKMVFGASKASASGEAAGTSQTSI